MTNEQVILSGGGNFIGSVMEDLEDRVMDKVNDEVEHNRYVFGIVLNNGRGFKFYDEANRLVKNFAVPPYQSLWKIDGKIYILVKMLGCPVFDIFPGDELQCSCGKEKQAESETCPECAIDAAARIEDGGIRYEKDY